MKYFLMLALAMLLSCCNGDEISNPPAREAVPEKPDASTPNFQFDYEFEAEGRKFRSFRSGKYGPNDIWLSYSADGKNYIDVFTGCALLPDALSDTYTAAYADGKVVISYERAVEFGENIEPARFVATLADIERDSDKDGLADLLEYRLMTNATNEDTDGDGTKDGEDSNPLASSKIRLTKQQEIWKQAFVQYQNKYPENIQLPPGRILLAVFESEADFFELPNRNTVVLAMVGSQVEKFAENIGYVFPQVCFWPVISLSPRENMNRVAIEIDILLEPLVGKRFKMILMQPIGQQTGEWKLTDIELIRIY